MSTKLFMSFLHRQESGRGVTQNIMAKLCLMVSILIFTTSLSSCGMKRALTLPKNNTQEKQAAEANKPLKPIGDIRDNQEMDPDTDNTGQRSDMPVAKQLNSVE